MGKGEVKSSRIFHQCYVKCCKLQNLTPLASVLPNGQSLDFCVDRIKYVDWPPILNALSCDLSLQSVSIRCRQQVKTVLEQIDCERLAKTVTKRAVILTNFMLSNLLEALAALLRGSGLLDSLLLEGLPLRAPYLTPLCDAILANGSLQHVLLPRCALGDAGCAALCRAVRRLPAVLSLDLSGCDLTPLGAGYIADLIKYQKIHRYSENWVHTLRYRSPELDAMAGLRRIRLAGNTQLGDAGAARLFQELADDLWIKALDVQNCGIGAAGGAAAADMMRSNTALVALELRHNQLAPECLAELRRAVRRNDRGHATQYQWPGDMSSSSSDGRPAKQVSKTKIERAASKARAAPNYHTKSSVVKKDRDYSEVLEEQLQEEVCHRQQLEALNLQLVQQLQRLKQQQAQLWAGDASSGSEPSLASGSSEPSSSSGSVPVEQHTLAYIQRAFTDIYAFIRDNQCHGPCPESQERDSRMSESETDAELEREVRASPKRAQSEHARVAGRARKVTRSAHLLGRLDPLREKLKPEMMERCVGDVKTSYEKETEQREREDKKEAHRDAPALSLDSASDSDTLVSSPAPHPRRALLTSSDEDED